MISLLGFFSLWSVASLVFVVSCWLLRLKCGSGRSPDCILNFAVSLEVKCHTLVSGLCLFSTTVFFVEIETDLDFWLTQTTFAFIISLINKDLAYSTYTFYRMSRNACFDFWLTYLMSDCNKTFYLTNNSLQFFYFWGDRKVGVREGEWAPLCQQKAAKRKSN